MDTEKSADTKKYAPIKYVFEAVIIGLFLGILVACDSSSSDNTSNQVSKLARQINEQLTTHSNKLGELIPSQDQLKKSSSEEIQKIFAVEYLVVELEPEIDLANLQNKLSEMGKERWDCFSQISGPQHLRLLCKRRPLSALRTLIGVGAFL